MSATISLLFGLLVAIVILATLASRLRLPYAPRAHAPSTARRKALSARF